LLKKVHDSKARRATSDIIFNNVEGGDQYLVEVEVLFTNFLRNLKSDVFASFNVC